MLRDLSFIARDLESILNVSINLDFWYGSTREEREGKYLEAMAANIKVGCNNAMKRDHKPWPLRQPQPGPLSLDVLYRSFPLMQKIGIAYHDFRCIYI